MTTDDDDLAEKLRLLRVHGMRPKYYHKVVGVNSRLDALQAAVLGVKLKYLDWWSDARRRNAEHYDNLFAEAGVEEVTTPSVRPNRRHIFNQYTIRCSRRDELMDFLKRRGGVGDLLPGHCTFKNVSPIWAINRGICPRPSELRANACRCRSTPN